MLGIIIVVGILIILVWGVTASSHQNKTTTNTSLETYLRDYTGKRKHPRFKKVLVVIDGVNGIDKTVRSILKQDIQVDEIATCNDAKLGQGRIVVNKYKDPWSKGIVKSTWEREFDKGTIAIFVKGGREFRHTRYLSQLLNRWTQEQPLKHDGILVMKSEQFKS